MSCVPFSRPRSGWTAALIVREKPGVPNGPGLLYCAPLIAAAQLTSPPTDWPADQERPSPSLLYEWLNRVSEEKLVRCRARAGRMIRIATGCPTRMMSISTAGSCRPFAKGRGGLGNEGERRWGERAHFGPDLIELFRHLRCGRCWLRTHEHLLAKASPPRYHRWSCGNVFVAVRRRREVALHRIESGLARIDHRNRRNGFHRIIVRRLLRLRE
jgi:hypothetical protein